MRTKKTFGWKMNIRKSLLGLASVSLLVNAMMLTTIFDPRYVFAAASVDIPAGDKVAGVSFNVVINSDTSGTVELTDLTGSLTYNPMAITSGVPLTMPVRITKDSTGLTNQQNKITVKVNGLPSAPSAGFKVVADASMPQIIGVDGDGQTGSVTSKLPKSLKIKTVDPFGNTLMGMNVAFNIQTYPAGAAGTVLSRTSGPTNSSGEAATELTLGSKVGSYAVRASTNNGASGVTFFANATPDQLSKISIVPSAAVVVQSSLQQFSLTASDAHGNPINLSSVSWRVVNGGGSIDANGLFSSANAVGTFNNTVEAVVGGIKSSATVTVMSNSGFSGTNASNNPSSQDERNIGQLDRVEIMPKEIVTPAGSQQLISAQGYDVFNNALATISYGWEATGEIGNLSSGYGPNTLLKAGVLPGSGSLQVTATQGDKKVTAQATVSVVAGQGGLIEFGKIDSPQQAGTPFRITITVKDAAGNIVSTTPTPIVLSDSTGTISPRVITKLSAGVWTGEVTIHSGDENVVILANASGFSGASNGFKVEGESSVVTPGGQSNQVLGFVDNNKVAFAIVAGLGLLGSAMALGLLGGKGLQAIGRNPLARKQIFLNLYLNAGIAILAAFISIALALMLKSL
jgi:F0F1-type ATP synthase membrane subunit c/vacuolar-type H+-ATPase subunit K